MELKHKWFESRKGKFTQGSTHVMLGTSKFYMDVYMTQNVKSMLVDKIDIT
jgi:hypothetical protein